MPTLRIIQNALSFLSRLDLKGQEAPQFMEVIMWIESEGKRLQESQLDERK